MGFSGWLITTPYGCATSHSPKLKRVSWRERFAKFEMLKYQTGCGIETYGGVSSLFRTGKAAATRVVFASSKRASHHKSVDGTAQTPSLDRAGVPELAAQRSRRIASQRRDDWMVSEEGSERLIYMLQRSYVDQSPAVARRLISLRFLPRFRQYPIPIRRQSWSRRRLNCNLIVPISSRYLAQSTCVVP